MTTTLFTTRLAAVLLTGLTTAMPHVAAAQSAPAGPAAPASLTGTWTVGLITDHVVPMAFVLEQQGQTVSGTLGFMGKDYPLAGEVSEGRLRLASTFPAGGGRDGTHGSAVIDVTFTGAWDTGGGLAGDFVRATGDGRPLKWTAERLKARRPTAGAAVVWAGVTLDGAWQMTVVEAQLAVGISLTQCGTRLSGSATSDHLGPMTLEGTFMGGVVTLVGRGAAQGQDLRMDFTGSYAADGTLAGAVTSPAGAMTWTAARVKPQP